MQECVYILFFLFTPPSFLPFTSMESNINGKLLSSSSSTNSRYSGDGNNEHGDSKTKRATWQTASKDAPQDHTRRQGSRSSTLANSLYDSPKQSSSSDRRHASLQGSALGSIPADPPILTQDFADLWSDKAMSESSLSHKDPSASMIIEDATPPLPWKETSTRFNTSENMSSSQRFSVDSLSGGGTKAVQKNEKCKMQMQKTRSKN